MERKILFKRLSIIVVLALTLAGCNDYFDVVPKGDITTIESTFEQRDDARKWLVSCFTIRNSAINNMISNPAYWGADEIMADDYIHNNYNIYITGIHIAEGQQKTQEPYGDIWSVNRVGGGYSILPNYNYYQCIRYCNNFLTHIDGTYNMDADEKAFWKAEVRACKAHAYFELMRRDGPFILVPQNIDANASISEMQQPRAPIDSCVNAIVALCDSAIAVLPDKNSIDRGFLTTFTREGAATLKAMTLLYAASPLFNGNTQFASMTNKNGERLFPDYDKEKWHRAAVAADEAIDMAKGAGNELESGSSSRSTSMLNTMLDLENSWNDLDVSNKEALVVTTEYRGTTELYSANAFYFPKVISGTYADNNVIGGVGATMKMVEKFYTEHGLPLSEDKQWIASQYQMFTESDRKYIDVVKLNTPVLGLHLRREPRFYASLISHGTYWYHRVTNTSTTYDAIDCNMLQGQIFGTNLRSYNSSSPQCLTGYYVKKFDVSDIGKRDYLRNYSSKGQRYLIVFRLPDLLLASSEAWNEYLDAPDERVYKGIDEVRERAGIPKVRDAWNTYARNPQNCTTQAGMRDIIHQEWDVEFAFEGRRFYNLRRWMTAPEELNDAVMGWNILGDTEEKFFNRYQGPIVVSTKRSFTAPRDYFFPIDAEQIMISGVKQNLGW